MKRRILTSLLYVLPAAAVEWRPVDPNELRLKQPKIQADADAEAIFWEVAIEDKFTADSFELAYSHYVRLKIFTDRGVKEYATVEIPQLGKNFVVNVAGRTIKPDGTIVDLKKDAIFDRDLVKTKGFKAKGKSFALPQVEPGDVVEYQYREVHPKAVANYVHLHFQRDMPVWRASYQLKPLQFPGDFSAPYMRTMAFNTPPLTFSKSKTRMGYYETFVENLPAFKSEPYMPPDEQVRAWMLVYYEEDRKINQPAKFWNSVGKSSLEAAKDPTKVDGSVKKLAQEITSGAATPELKMAAIESFCRSKIRNLSWSASGVSAEERKDFKLNPNPASTLKQKIGTGDDVRYLFVALAQAAGLDARIALVSDRGEKFFEPGMLTRAFLRGESVAVKIGDGWRFYDPGTPLIPPGSIRWQEEGLPALILDSKEPFFSITQATAPAGSVRHRRAALKLLDDGTLEGTLQYRYTGHVGVEQKRRLDDMSENERIEDWKESLVSRLSTAEISDLKIENAIDPEKPVTVTCRISVPGYATRTGKRILVQPAFFQRNIGASFQSGTREHDIYFPYAWTEDDEVTIELPDDWDLDQAMAPQGYDITNFGQYHVELMKNQNGGKLTYRRQFVWGTTPGLAGLMVGKEAYPHLKKVFESVHEQDNHMITLKPGAGRAAN